MILSYKVEELFSFDEFGAGDYLIKSYLRKDDPEITEVEIPAEYNGIPVTLIGAAAFRYSLHLKRVVIPPSVRIIDDAAFSDCPKLDTVELSEGLDEIKNSAFSNSEFIKTNLKSLVLPKSLTSIGNCAFQNCCELESVIFNSTPRLGRDVFFGCRLLPADVTLMGLLGSCDLSTPFDKEYFAEAFFRPLFGPGRAMRRLFEHHYTHEAILSPKVFELAVENDCFRNVDVSVMTNYFIEYWSTGVVRLAWEHGFLDGRELLDKHIEYSVRQGTNELTAYLLELKKRKFGFTGGNDFEL